MKTIFFWLKTEISSQNKNLIAINWKIFLLFPFSVYKINKFYFFVYVGYLYLFFWLDTTKFVATILQNQDSIIFFTLLIETILRFIFLPIIVYFCIDKSKISATSTNISKNYQAFLFIPLSFLVLLSYDLGLIVFGIILSLTLICFVILKIRTINLILFSLVFQIALYIKFLNLFVRHENNFGLVYLVAIYITILVIFFYDKFNTKDKKCLL